MADETQQQKEPTMVLVDQTNVDKYFERQIVPAGGEITADGPKTKLIGWNCRACDYAEGIVEQAAPVFDAQGKPDRELPLPAPHRCPAFTGQIEADIVYGITRLGRERRELAALKELYENQLAQWKAQPNIAQLAITIARATKHVEFWGGMAGELAVDDFRRSGRKSFPAGVKVIEKNIVQVDEFQALTWALEHKQALKLDRAKFDQLVKAGADGTEFAKVIKVPEPRLPTVIDCFRVV